ncbi:MAG: amidohydrolase family protein, partial [Xanthobacteraceae bacterium]
MRTITLEEHFTTPKFLEGPGRARQQKAQQQGGRFIKIFEQLADVGPGRLADMDAAGIDMQVLSLTSPGTEQLEAAEALALTREANDFLAEVVKGNPKRYAGLAVLPTAAPDKAAAELELRVRQQKFVGAVIHGHNRGRYLDNKFFWPILEAAEKLNAPIYLHPTPPPQGVIDISYGG